MNAALALLTAACMAGDHHEPAHHHAAPVVHQGCSSGCGYSDCCDSPGILDRIRGLFNRNRCGCDTGCYTWSFARSRCHTSCDACDTGCRRRHGCRNCGNLFSGRLFSGRLLSGWNRGCGCNTGCYTYTHSCNTSCCDDCDGGILGRLRGLFNRNRWGCNYDCCGCASYIVDDKGGERIEIPQPKKMPSADDKGNKGKGGAKGTGIEVTPTVQEPPAAGGNLQINSPVQPQGTGVRGIPTVPAIPEDLNGRNPF